MKRTMLLAAFAAVATAWAIPASAQDTRVQIEREDDQMFEAGVVAGFPTGVSAKYWLDRKAAIQGAAAWNPGTGGLIGSVDALMHTDSLSAESEITLPLYAGIGARVVEYDEN